MEMSRKGIRAKAPRKLMIIPMPTQMTASRRRKCPTQRKTRMRLLFALSRRRSMRPFTMRERSFM